MNCFVNCVFSQCRGKREELREKPLRENPCARGKNAKSLCGEQPTQRRPPRCARDREPFPCARENANPRRSEHRPSRVAQTLDQGAPIPMSYRPLKDGIPNYFFPMLADHSREDAYAAAIRACLADLARATCDLSRPLRVLDFGCGTGLLGLLVLRAAADLERAVHVTFLDCNASMLESAAYEVERTERPPSATVSFFLGTCTRGRRGVAVFDEPVDMVVSEILGTFAMSEGMPKYLGDAVKLVKPHGGVVHVVPTEVSQFAEVRDESILVASKAHASSFHALQLCRRRAEHLCLHVNHQPEFDQTIPCEHRVLLSSHSFGGHGLGDDEPRKSTKWTMRFRPSHILAFTWEAKLWGDHKLCNDFASANPGRMNAWGIPLCFVLPHAAEEEIDATLEVHWPPQAPMPRRINLVATDPHGRKVLGRKRANAATELLAEDSDDDGSDDDDYEDSGDDEDYEDSGDEEVHPPPKRRK